MISNYIGNYRLRRYADHIISVEFNSLVFCPAPAVDSPHSGNQRIEYYSDVFVRQIGLIPPGFMPRAAT